VVLVLDETTRRGRRIVLWNSHLWSASLNWLPLETRTVSGHWKRVVSRSYAVNHDDTISTGLT
jgi:hypothetical protein